jgi:predicted membrane protein
MDQHRSRGAGRLILGFVLLGLGILWTLDNMGIYESERLVRWWPLVLILIGLSHLSGSGGNRRIMSGTLLTGAGVLLMLDRLGLVNVNLWTLWPLFLAAVGAMIVVRSLRNSGTATSEPGPVPEADRDASLNSFAFMSETTRRSTSTDLHGGEVTAIMAGAQIDLRGASSAGGQVVIDVFTIWGGIDVIIPDDWTVVCEVTAILGGFDDKTRPPIGPATTKLVVRGFVIMGGVEVKNG